MVVKLTQDTYENEVMKAEGTVLVDFYADWCGPCKMQGPIVDQLSEERTDVKFCKLNIDEAMEIAMAWYHKHSYHHGSQGRKDHIPAGRPHAEGTAQRSAVIAKVRLT